MAVIEELGLAVSIVINGRHAVEYHDPAPITETDFPGVKYSSKYIESQDDTNYSISCKVLPTHRWLPTNNDNILSFNFRIDGESRRFTAARAKRWERGRGVSYTMEGVEQPTGAHHGVLLKFKFAAIHALEDANVVKVKEDLRRAKNIGLIRVEIFRCTNLHKTLSENNMKQLGNNQDLSIAEKALKGRAVSHGTTYSTTSQKKRLRPHITVHRIDPKPKPYAVFDFHYRSKDALRSEMITPRTLSPTPSLNGIEEVEGLSQEELRRLARERLAEIRNEHSVKREAPVLKREFGQTIDLTEELGRNVRPKREHDVQPAVKQEGLRNKEPVIIDLLDDSDGE